VLGPTLSLDLPIFEHRRGVIGRLEAQRRQAQRHLDELAINARSEVRLASAKLDVTRHAAERYKKSLLPTRATVLEETQLEYNGMQVGLYELLAAKQAQIESVRSYIETVRDYWMARAELERALGGMIPAARVATADPPPASKSTSPAAAPTHVHGAQ